MHSRTLQWTMQVIVVSVMTCHRELFHAQWGVLLDDEFIEAYKHGIVSQCYNGTTH